jgi:hypothetical protein
MNPQLLFLVLGLSFYYVSAQNGDMKRLRDTLLNKQKYDRVTRPVKDFRTPTNVKMAITPIHFTDLDTSTNVLTTESWIQNMWDDEFLKWDPKDYGNLTEIRFLPSEIWKPDLLLYNGGDMAAGTQISSQNLAIVYNTGLVLWIPTATLKTICNVDLTDYPFDTQVCNVTIGSWTRNSEQIKLSIYESEMSSHPMFSNPTWDLVGTTAVIEKKLYNCTGCGVYESFTMGLTIKRRTQLYHYTVCMPTIAAVILLLLVFWLPTNWLTTRIFVAGLSLFLFYSTLNLMTSEVGHSAKGVPFGIRSLSILMVLASASVLLSILVFYLAKKSHPCSLPSAVSSLINGPFGAILCLDCKRSRSESECELPSADSQTCLKGGNHSDREWAVFATLLDRVFFVVYILALFLRHV